MNKSTSSLIPLKLVACLLACSLFLALPALAQNSEAQQAPVVKLQKVQEIPTSKTLLQTTSSAEFNGTLVYGDFLPLPSSKGQNWTAFLKLNQTGKVAQSTAKSAFKVVNANDRAYNPQFSPDGKTVMFKTGQTGSRHPYYTLCFWNLQTNQIQVGPSNLNYLLTYWSPDSKFVAYIEGGDIEGNDSPEHPLQLYIYDVKTNESRLVAKNTLVKQMAWTHQNTLLYSMRQEEKLQVSSSVSVNRVDLYVASPQSGSSRLLLKNAFDAQSAPDGKKLAFFAWPEPEDTLENQSEKPRRVQAQLGLYLYDRETKKRTLLRSPFSRLSFAGMRWLPDNQHLLLLQNLAPSPDAKLQLSILDTDTTTTKNLVVIQANDFKKLSSRIDTEPQFQLLQISKDGKFCFVKVSEFVGRDSPWLIEEKSLQAVNLNTGEVVAVATVKNSYGPLGLDWHR